MSELAQIKVAEPSANQGGRISPWSDWFGMVASIGCAIHCAAMPFVVASLPALGLSFLADESFHQVMAVVCIAIALFAFVPGWKKHGRLIPAGVGIVGLVLISSAAFGLEGDCCLACKTSATEITPSEAATMEAATMATPGDDSLSASSLFTETSVKKSAPEEAVCTEHCCEHCALEANGARDASEATNTAETPAVEASLAGLAPIPTNAFLSRIAPWLTPLGGLILVVAHLLNRHFGCLCGCCESQSSERQLAEGV